MMTTNELLKDLTDECWCVEVWSEHPPEKIYYTAKLTCGVQARGRYKEDGDTFEEALKKVHKTVMDRWGKI
jgi:hypothetical protein